MPDLAWTPPTPELEEAFLGAVDREGKVPAALEELGPLSNRDVLLLDGGDGVWERRLAELGARVTPLSLANRSAEAEAVAALAALSPGSFDVVLAPWSELAVPGSPVIAAAAALLRPKGRLLILHDYGRDDVWGLWPDRRERLLAWSHRKGPFLGRGFRVRVIHCRWTFDSADQAEALLGAAFGDRGVQMAGSMKRLWLEYKVAIYHCWAEETSRAMGAGGGPVIGADAGSAAGVDPPTRRVVSAPGEGG